MFESAVESRPAFLEDLLSSDGGQEATDTGTSEDVLSQLRGVPSAGPGDILTTFLQQQVQAVLRLSSAPSPTVGFFDLGMDSLMRWSCGTALTGLRRSVHCLQYRGV